MHLPSVKVVQKSMLIRPLSRPCIEARRGSRQGVRRSVGGSLSTLLLHSRLQSGLAIAVTAALCSSDMVLTARAEARGCSMEGSDDAVRFIKRGSFNLSLPAGLFSCPPVSLFHSYICFKSCLFLHLEQSVLFLRPTLLSNIIYCSITGTPRC